MCDSQISQAVYYEKGNMEKLFQSIIFNDIYLLSVNFGMHCLYDDIRACYVMPDIRLVFQKKHPSPPNFGKFLMIDRDIF